MMLCVEKICLFQDRLLLTPHCSSLSLASMLFCNPFSRTRHNIFPAIVKIVIPLQTLTVCQMMFSIFGNLSTIATATHFNSYAGMKSTPAALLFARAFNPSSIPSLEITFIEKVLSVALIISLSKSNKTVGIGRFRTY